MLSAAPWPLALRHQQTLALDALDAAWQRGERRACVVLPPGAGKTVVGLEAARRLGRRTVVFGPNTAIQGQWATTWESFPASPPAGSDAALSCPVTVLTYQALASFDPDAEVDEDGAAAARTTASPRAGDRLLNRLHPHGLGLVDALRRAGPITLVLDECHHLLEVWGRLLAEVLDELADAHVVALTATPDERTSALGPMLVTGRTVATSRRTAEAFLDFARATSGRGTLGIGAADPAGVVEIAGPWTPRAWVPLVTAFFEAGHCQALVGTRGLLGEGWDARGVNVLVDLTAATTVTSVVQTRGRALRLDPAWPDKVANNWSVVCVAEDHPKGAADWDRLVRKHTGYLALDSDGLVTDGVTHLHPLFSPYEPPPASAYDRLNAEMLRRADDRDAVRAGWRVGSRYRDELAHTVRITRPGRAPAPAPPPAGHRPAEPSALPSPSGVHLSPGRPLPGHTPWQLLPAAAAAGAGVAQLLPWLAAGGAGLAGMWVTGRITAPFATARLRDIAAADPGILPFAYAVADALHAGGLSPVGAEGVRADIDPRGAYLITLDPALPAVTRPVTGAFAVALDEVLAPMAAPRYVVPRHVLSPTRTGPWGRWRDGRAALRGRCPPRSVVWHAVPTAFGVNAARAAVFAAAWSTWVNAGSAAVYTGSPEGEGVLVASRGNDPLDASTALRITWS